MSECPHWWELVQAPGRLLRYVYRCRLCGMAVVDRAETRPYNADGEEEAERHRRRL